MMRNKLFPHTRSDHLFATALPTPDIKIDIFVMIDILIVIGLYLLLNNKIFLPAGVGVELPRSENIQQCEVSHIITIKNNIKDGKNRDNRLLILDDTVSSMNSLKRDLQMKSKKTNHQNPILLRADKSTDLGTIIKISNIIREAGYTGIQLALNGT